MRVLAVQQHTGPVRGPGGEGEETSRNVSGVFDFRKRGRYPYFLFVVRGVFVCVVFVFVYLEPFTNKGSEQQCLRPTTKRRCDKRLTVRAINKSS